MKILDVRGQTKNKNVSPYVIRWDAKSRSKFQFRIKQFLRKYWQFDLVFEEFPVVGSRKTVDFFNYNKKIAIEVQGFHHQSFVKHFQENRNKWLEQIKRDVEKQKWCELNKFHYIEIYPEDEKFLSQDFFIQNFNISLI